MFGFNTPASHAERSAMYFLFWSLWAFNPLFIQLSEGEPTQTVPKDEEPVASCVPHCYTQDVCLACRLPPGAYTIVPSTYQPDCSASFTLSLECRIHRLALLSWPWSDQCSDRATTKLKALGFVIVNVELQVLWSIGLLQESREKSGKTGSNHSRGQCISNTAKTAH